MRTPFDYVIDLVMDSVRMGKIPQAIRAVMPILMELVQSDVILTDKLRAELQGKVLLALRRAGLEGVDIG